MTNPPMAETSDTFARSCDHWSEKNRSEMEAFYALASVDYRHLAEAVDWREWLKDRQRDAGTRSLNLLDVACGSGKFPAALMAYGGVDTTSVEPIRYALLDPSGFSIEEARSVLQPPFAAAEEFEITLQELSCPPGTFDIVWATHALYAIPKVELRAGLERFVNAMAKGTGAGFIAHASDQAHYLKFYRHYLDDFKAAQGEPYSSSEEITNVLNEMGASFETRDITYTNGAPDSERHHVEGYLQRCVFDDTISLDDMLTKPKTGAYLQTCLESGVWKFQQRVSLIFIST
ncbi:MAG: class I SAM-dependent methyltransferase [Pseudomonadota bacterium]